MKFTTTPVIWSFGFLLFSIYVCYVFIENVNDSFLTPICFKLHPYNQTIQNVFLSTYVPKSRLEIFELGQILHNVNNNDDSEINDEHINKITLLTSQNLTLEELKHIKILLNEMDQNIGYFARLVQFISFVNILWFISLIGIIFTLFPTMYFLFNPYFKQLIRALMYVFPMFLVMLKSFFDLFLFGIINYFTLCGIYNHQIQPDIISRLMVINSCLIHIPFYFIVRWVKGTENTFENVFQFGGFSWIIYSYLIQSWFLGFCAILSLMTFSIAKLFKSNANWPVDKKFEIWDIMQFVSLLNVITYLVLRLKSWETLNYLLSPLQILGQNVFLLFAFIDYLFSASKKIPLTQFLISLFAFLSIGYYFAISQFINTSLNFIFIFMIWTIFDLQVWRNRNIIWWFFLFVFIQVTSVFLYKNPDFLLSSF